MYQPHDKGYKTRKLDTNHVAGYRTLICKDAEAEHKSGIRGEDMKEEGALYYKTPLKVNWFGILNYGKPHMFNYIFTEDDLMGLDNANSHSSSAVVSMIDDFFHIINCFINCDNCGGQNKNQTVIGYFCWRTILGYHKEINLHFLQPYHARCQIDGMFGIALKYTQNQAMVGFGEIGKFFSATILSPYQMYGNPGDVVVKESVDSEEKSVCILKNGKSVNRDLSSTVESAGLSATRQWYLYRNIRSFIPPRLQDITAPMPSVPETSVVVEEKIFLCTLTFIL
ncbi:hypothetical protein KUTeg_002628 [Tegillarca granosa]|uniref:DUF7869 domain-containing protein n=1 Tax=Tegillarca granosa TaxID=220873 RepID=A0ABQ9FY43_TEGGR|nr:hypothetical protein KUTeg_002628 [Tegillarca granosa]